ncbi:MAG: prepilin-type N-terminal cleavage/methylation domain-containing protein [Polyangiaceae bacterium]
MTRRFSRQGFTLLEVMVAVAILGIGLTAILSAQWVSFASVRHARNVSEATGLLRCKMSEVEWDVAQNGYPINDVTETGACCDGEENSKMTCTYSIEKPEFPQAKFGELDLDSELDFSSGGPGVLPGLGATSGGSGAAPGLAAFAFMKAGKGAIGSSTDAGAIADNFMGGADGVTDSLAALVMQVVYPDLKGIFEAGTRKLTVKIAWYEGSKEHSIQLEQWVTSSKDAGLFANMGGLMAQDDEEDDGTGTTGTNGSNGSNGANGSNGSNGKPSGDPNSVFGGMLKGRPR